MDRYRDKWLTLGDGTDGFVHVLPETDIKPHSTQNDGEKREVAEHDCPCKPKVSLEGTCYLIVHNSFQDKEFLEELLELNEPPIKASKNSCVDCGISVEPYEAQCSDCRRQV